MKHLNGRTLLRLALAGIFLSHAFTRISLGGVAPFGEFLNSQGFAPAGFYLAWGVTLFEIAGATCLIAGRYLPVICALFIVHQIGGITLVHFPEGWFVVGAGRNGMEYSFLLIFSLLATGFPNYLFKK